MSKTDNLRRKREIITPGKGQVLSFWVFFFHSLRAIFLYCVKLCDEDSVSPCFLSRQTTPCFLFHHNLPNRNSSIYFHHLPPPPFLFFLFVFLPFHPDRDPSTHTLRYCTYQMHSNLPPSSRRELRTTAASTVYSRRPFTMCVGTLHRCCCFFCFFFASMLSEWVPFTATFICHHYKNLRLVASLDLTHLTDSDVAALYIPCFLPFFFFFLFARGLFYYYFPGCFFFFFLPLEYYSFFLIFHTRELTQQTLEKKRNRKQTMKTATSASRSIFAAVSEESTCSRVILPLPPPCTRADSSTLNRNTPDLP